MSTFNGRAEDIQFKLIAGQGITISGEHDEVISASGSGIATVDVLPESASENTIVYLNGVGFYRYTTEWVRITKDDLESTVGTLSATVSGLAQSIPSTEKQQSWDSAVADKHTHSNKETLDAITSEKVSAWDSAATNKHTHSNKPVLDAITSEKTAGWDSAVTDKHTHGNKASLDKMYASEKYSELPTVADGAVGLVTGLDSSVKSFADYDAETDADKPLSIACELTYDSTAVMNGNILGIESSDNTIGITLLPVYAEGTADPTFGGLDMILETAAVNPKKYIVLVTADTIDTDKLFDDIGVTVSAQAQVALVMFMYAHETISGNLESAESGDDPVSVSVQTGWNAFYVVVDGEDEIVGTSAVSDPNEYCEIGTFEFITSADATHPFLYDVIELGMTDDKRGVYYRSNGRWVEYYEAEINGLSDRVYYLEHGKPDDVTLLGFDTYNDLIIRNTIQGESIQNVPVFVHGSGLICSLYTYTASPVGVGYDYGLELNELRQNDTGMPLRILTVTVNGTRYSYFPENYRNSDGSTRVSAGWNISDSPSDPPTISNFTPDRFSYNGTVYDDLDDLTDEAKSALRSLSQCINTSALAMGSISVPEDAVERFNGTIQPNHKYSFVTADDCTITLPSASWSEQDQQFVIYLECTADTDFTFSAGTLFANTPNTAIGSHKLIGCYLRDKNKWSVGGIDYEAVT